MGRRKYVVERRRGRRRVKRVHASAPTHTYAYAYAYAYAQRARARTHKIKKLDSRERRRISKSRIERTERCMECVDSTSIIERGSLVSFSRQRISMDLRYLCQMTLDPISPPPPHRPPDRPTSHHPQTGFVS